jgi:hypothetical protein
MVETRDVAGGVDTLRNSAIGVTDDAVGDPGPTVGQPPSRWGRSDGHDDHVGREDRAAVEDHAGDRTVGLGEASDRRLWVQVHAVLDVGLGQQSAPDVAERAGHRKALTADEADRGTQTRGGGGDFGAQDAVAGNDDPGVFSDGAAQVGGVFEGAQDVQTRRRPYVRQHPRDRAGSDHDVLRGPFAGRGAHRAASNVQSDGGIS